MPTTPVRRHFPPHRRRRAQLTLCREAIPNSPENVPCRYGTEMCALLVWVAAPKNWQDGNLDYLLQTRGAIKGASTERPSRCPVYYQEKQRHHPCDRATI